MEIKHLELTEEFEALKKEYQFLVVDFYSDECPPCEKLAPIYEKVATLFPAVKFVKIFRQQYRELAQSLGVSGSPTILFFKNGELLEQKLSGEIAEKDLVDILEKISEQASLKIEDQAEITKTDLCIIGNGPAGMTAAIYGARYKIKQIMIGDLPGGLMMSSHKICNFPSQTEISGAELSMKMASQVKTLGVEEIIAQVEKIEIQSFGYLVQLSNGQKIEAKTIILATGTKHKHLNLPGEKELAGRGVSYCATCDAMFYAGKTVVVVGGSDIANTASLYLAQVAKQVYQVYRGNALRGETAWIDLIKVNPKITVLYNTELTDILGGDKVSGVKLNKEFNGQTELLVDGVFIEAGSSPELTLINQLQLKVDAGNYIITEASQKTSQERVWAAGDITTGSDGFRQIITACSEGAVAVHSVFEYLKKLG